MHRHVLVLSSLLALALPAGAVGTSALVGTWEAARSPDDERLYVNLTEKGTAEIVAEYDFTLPGMPGKRRGRSTTFGKWSVKGNEVVIAYAKVRDRLRYAAKLSLDEIGLPGTSAALKPSGKADSTSRIGSAVLWKAPHRYKLKAAENGAAPGLSAEPAAPTN